MNTPNESKSTARQDDTSRDQATLANRAHEAADGARQVALDRVQAARASAQEAKERAAEKLRKLGGTVRKVGEHLRVEEQYYVAERANDVSQRLDNVATYLSSAELATLLNDTRTVARRNPGWFFGGAFVLGLAAGRFLKGGADTDNSRDTMLGKQRSLPATTSAKPDSSDTPRSEARVQSGRPGSATTPDTRGKEQPVRSGVNR